MDKGKIVEGDSPIAQDTESFELIMLFTMNAHAVGVTQVASISPMRNLLCVYNLRAKKDAATSEKGSFRPKSTSKEI